MATWLKRGAPQQQRADIQKSVAETVERILADIEARGDAGYFGMFAVVPTLQRSGVGGAILAEAERIAGGEWRLPRMRMTVIDLREELIAWYERRGYHRTGETLPFPATDPRFGLPKRNDLRFAVLEKELPHG